MPKNLVSLNEIEKGVLTSSTLVASEVLGGEVGETIRGEQVSNAQASGFERSSLGLSAESVGNISTTDGRVDERSDSTESGVGRESGITADGGEILNERVEVLLSSDHSDSGSEGISTIAELLEDLVTTLELSASVGTGKKIRDGLASDGGGSARVTTLDS